MMTPSSSPARATRCSASTPPGPPAAARKHVNVRDPVCHLRAMSHETQIRHERGLMGLPSQARLHVKSKQLRVLRHVESGNIVPLEAPRGHYLVLHLVRLTLAGTHVLPQRHALNRQRLWGRSANGCGFRMHVRESQRVNPMVQSQLSRLVRALGREHPAQKPLDALTGRVDRLEDKRLGTRCWEEHRSRKARKNGVLRNRAS